MGDDVMVVCKGTKREVFEVLIKILNFLIVVVLSFFLYLSQFTELTLKECTFVYINLINLTKKTLEMCTNIYIIRDKYWVLKDVYINMCICVFDVYLVDSNSFSV